MILAHPRTVSHTVVHKPVKVRGNMVQAAAFNLRGKINCALCSSLNLATRELKGG